MAHLWVVECHERLVPEWTPLSTYVQDAREDAREDCAMLRASNKHLKDRKFRVWKYERAE